MWRGTCDRAGGARGPLITMFVLGLTGSIGMGKSTVAGMFACRGALVHDADAVVHRLYGPAGAAVAGRRPPGARGAARLGRAAWIDRAALGRAVLDDPRTLRALEAVVHPLVDEARARFLRRARRRGAGLVVLDLPLLFETGRRRQVDAVCVVTAPAFLQARRVLRRPGMSAAGLERLRRRQMPDALKRRHADIVIATGRSKGATLRRVAAVARGAEAPPRPGLAATPAPASALLAGVMARSPRSPGVRPSRGSPPHGAHPLTGLTPSRSALAPDGAEARHAGAAVRRRVGWKRLHSRDVGHARSRRRHRDHRLDVLDGHRVVEIGCVELVNHLPTGRSWQSYLNPGRRNEREAFEVHGLSDRFLEAQPRFRDRSASFWTSWDRARS